MRTRFCDNKRINSTNVSMILSSSLFNNERIQTSKIVVIVYINYVNMFLLNHFMNQIRKFAHYQYYYYYIHRRSRLMHNRKQKRNHSNTKFFLYWKFLEKYNFQTERNHSNTKYFFVNKSLHSQFFFDLKFIRTRNIFFRLIWNSFEHELFVFCFDLISTFLFDHIEMIWKIIIVVIFAFDKFDLIETNCFNKLFSLQNFIVETMIDDNITFIVLVEISIILWS